MGRPSVFPVRHKGGLNRAFLIPRQPARFYARVTSRRTTVTEEQRRADTQTGVQPQEQARPWWQPSQQTQQQTQQTRETRFDDDDETTEQAITPEVSSFLMKVYGTMTGGLATAAVGGLVGTIAPGLAMPAMIGALVACISLAFVQKPSLRTTLFIGATGLLGLSIGPLLAISSPGAIMAAALGTSGIFGGFTLMAMKAKKKSMLTLGGPLFGCLIGLVLCSLGGMFLPMLGVTSPAILGALYNINLYGGLALFSVYISYDTASMIESFKQGETDHIRPAFNMFLNLFNIFVRLLSIFRD